MINEVKVVQIADRQAVPAKVAEWVRYPNRIRTGSDSLAELEAQDRTVTRIGANTIFSFGPDRSMTLERGSILFHTPKGKGGGKIQTGGASASVLGTTIIVTATDDGGFKTIVLEGKAEVRLPNGDFRLLNAGQLAFVLPGSQKFGPVLTINLGKLAVGSGLVNGFDRRLSSLDRIEQAMIVQSKMLDSGQAEDTGMLVGRRATETGVEIIDASLLEKAVAQTAAAENPAQEDAVVSGNDLPQEHVSEVDKNELPNSEETGIIGALVARNLTIRSSTIDLSPYMRGPGSEFSFYATEDLNVEGNVDFIGNSQPEFKLHLSGKNQLKIKSKARLTATGAGNLDLQSGGDFRMKTVQILNNSGDTDLGAGAILKYDKSSVTSSGSLRSQGTAQELRESTLTAQNGDADVGARNGDLMVETSTVGSAGHTTLSSTVDTDVNNDSSLSGTMISVEAGRDLRMQDTSLTGNSLAMQAGELLSWRNVSMSGLNNISLTARTLVLEDVAFASGSSVELRSELGVLAPNPNTGRAAVAGHVNFIRNVTYGGNPAQNAVGSGIQIRPR